MGKIATLIALAFLCVPCSSPSQADFTILAIEPRVEAGASLVVENAWKDGANGLITKAITISGTAARLLVVTVSGYIGAHANHAVTDNIDGATGWTKIVGLDNSGQRTGSMWYKANIPSGITTVTVNGGTGCNAVLGIVHEVSGASTSTPFTTGEYVALAQEGGGTTWGPGNVNIATANSVLFAFWTDEEVSNPSSGFTLNGSGTTGTWAYESTTNSRQISGLDFVMTASVPYVITTSTGNKTHVWDNLPNVRNTGIIAAFH